MAMRSSLVALAALAFVSTSAVAASCYEASIRSPTPFMGNNDEVFKLDDGSMWQVKYEYEYLYEYYPSVVICPDSGKLHIQGKALNIAPIGRVPQSGRSQSPKPAQASAIEAHIEGDFKGWDGETIFRLDNGQIWQQASYAYTYHYAYRPKVLIFQSGGQYKMQVEGMTDSINVRKIR
jgi:hypothetical protein